jgi:hypothetical protein
VNRTRVWLLVSPVVAAGVLVAHALAYRLTSTPTDPWHAYLGHVPQILLLLAFAGAVLAAVGGPRGAPGAGVFPVVALGVFVAQEHLERVAHGGVPVLVASPAFLVGLVLQIPVALLAWVVASWLLRAATAAPKRVAVRSRIERTVSGLRLDHVAAIALPSTFSRGPPNPLLSR